MTYVYESKTDMKTISRASKSSIPPSRRRVLSTLLASEWITIAELTSTLRRRPAALETRQQSDFSTLIEIILFQNNFK